MGWTIALLIAVNVAVLTASWFLLRGWLARRLSAPRQAEDLGEEVGRLVTELNQAAERNVVLLEDRVAALNELLATADKKIGLLGREIERHEAGSRVYGHLAGPRSRAAAAEAAAREGERAPVPGAEAVRTVAGSSPVAATGSTAREAPAAPASGVADARTEMRAEIRRLARGGLTPAAIAARIGAPLGEVELILSLELRARGS
jgi:hypothetical protein